jgi:hypothetical protein
MNFVKRFAWVLSLAGLVALSLYSLSGHVFADEHANGVAAPADITLANATRGVIFGTAAINPDGTVASCFNCNKSTTTHISTGQYQVGFQNFGNGNITAANGFSRWVQVDTLSAGAIGNTFCSTADRGGVPGAVYVLCQTSASGGTNVNVDTSFFLFVAR